MNVPEVANHDALEERFWWNTLAPDQLGRNLHGDPPYPLAPVVDLLSEYLGILDDDLVLDLGCGIGRLTKAMAEAHPKAQRFYGVDVSPTFVRMAQMNGSIRERYYVGDGRTLDFADGTFQAAYSVTVFQHLPHDAVRGYLAEVHRVLSPRSAFTFSWSLGDTDAFLSHPIPTVDRLQGWVIDAGFEKWRIWPDDGSIVPGWQWATAVKGAT